MPTWVETAVNEYQKRLPGNFQLIITESSPGEKIQSQLRYSKTL